MSALPEGVLGPEEQPSAPRMPGVLGMWDLPDGVLPLVPLRGAVLFPHVLMPVSVGRERSVAAVQQALRSQSPLAVVLQRNAQAEEPTQADVFEVGTLVQVLKALPAQAGQAGVLCQGLHRFRIIRWVEGYPFWAVQVQALHETQAQSTEAQALGLALREQGAEILSLLPGVPAEVATALQGLRSAGELADVTASLLDLSEDQKQHLLETLPLEERLRQVLQHLQHHLEVLRLSREMGAKTQETLAARERKHWLREQVKTIQRELGEDDTQAEEAETQSLRQAIERAGMPSDLQALALKEWGRLQRMGGGGADAASLQAWLECVAELPWALPQPAALDIEAAAALLEAEHHGLPKVKQRILEYLAVRKLNPQGRSPVLCFVGPPGVGKTTLGQSIARALQRPFVRVSLGGVHDEAEMRGHRRTYVGAMPGRIVAALRRAGARHCVMMFDEVDKLGRSAHGDPGAALLEILDPEQNTSFRDTYLGMPFDLSAVVFLATANVIEAVPAALRDRLEVLELEGYSPAEKLQIAKGFLLPRQRAAHGLSPQQFEIDDPALQAVVERYTREAGVRQLERELGRLMRQAATRIAVDAQACVRITPAELQALLGSPRHERERALSAAEVGVATGLAWTPTGGDILFIEATRVPGKGQLLLTGQLGEVMRESAQAALTLLKSRAAALGLVPASFEGFDIHLHVPAGAIPKDGPSAGVAIFVALASLWSQRPVRPEVAMTGEISLRGLVWPVGGIREKALAAQRAGLRTVLLPWRNQADWLELEAAIQQALQPQWLERVEDALLLALEPPAQAPS
jgi:ATP-dependent Lon protease